MAQDQNNQPNDFLKPRKKSWWWLWLIIIIVIAVIGIGYWQYSKPQESPYITEAAKIQNIRQSVEVTGTIKPADELNLNFKGAGNVENIDVKVGDSVKKGTVLASLESNEITSQLNQSRASIAVAQAQLKQVQEGNRPEEISIQEVNVQNAKNTLDNAKNNHELTKKEIENSNQQAQTNLNNIQKLLNESRTNLTNINNQTSQNLINTIDSNLNQINIILISELSAQANIEEIFDNNTWYNIFKNIDFIRTANCDNLLSDSKFKYQTALSSYNLAKTTKTEIDTQKATDDTIAYINTVSQILNNTNFFLYSENAKYFFSASDLATLKSRQSSNEATTNSNLTSAQNLSNAIENTKISNQTSIDNAKNQVVSYENQTKTAEENIVTTKIGNETKLNNSQEQVKNAEDQLKTQQEQLKLKKAGPTAAAIAVAQAQVAQATAASKVIEAQLSNLQIVAPIDGTITQINVSLGEQSTSANPAIQLQSNAKFEINADIAETDIDKIKIGDKTLIDFDAFSKDKQYDGTVVKIDPAATIIQGVVYYKTKVILESQDEKIKPGMTANIEIITAEKENALAVPNQSIKKENGQNVIEFIQDQKTNTTATKPVEIGLRGNSLTEIINGLKQGEEVIILKK